jgi:transposase
VQRLALHEKVHRLRRAGRDTLRGAIARDPSAGSGQALSLSPTTVYKYLSMSRLPERAARQRQPSILDPFVDYLTARWQAGCRNACQLWREIREQGYPGTHRQVLRWAYERRERPSPTTPMKYLDQGAQAEKQLLTLSEAADRAPLPVSRRLVWLFLKHSDQLEPEERTLRDQLLTHPVLVTAKKLAQDFQRMVRERTSRALEAWLTSCETAAIPELVNFAVGLRQDYAAVKAALSSTWSNGQTEGHVNRLKLLKRQMYGRAHFDLLRLRCLHPT